MTRGFPDMVKLLIPFLGQQLPGIDIVVRVPESRPAEFIRLWRNGGPASSRIVDRPMITFDTWAQSEARAFELADQVRQALRQAAAEIPVVRGLVEITGPYDIPDEESGTARARFSVQFTVRALRSA